MSNGKKLQQKKIWKRILGAWEHSRNDLLEREKQQMSELKVTFSITYYPAFQNVRTIEAALQTCS